MGAKRNALVAGGVRGGKRWPFQLADPAVHCALAFEIQLKALDPGEDPKKVSQLLVGVQSGDKETEAFVATTQRRSGESRSETLAPSRLELAASNEYDSDDHFEAQVAGVSVSGSGFLVLLQTSNAEATTTFPIQLTETSTIEEVTNATENRLPSLFQDNNDQSSVNTAEALTFLQLLNGVDMATMVLPPDMLSLISVWYAFLIDEYSVEVEDELGLSDETNVSQDSSDALEYIRTMVRTTMPTTEIGSTLSYIDASAWQRARVQLPRVWLRGVKLDVVEPQIMSSDDGRRVRTVPIKFTLECSVDDGSKFLEIPLFSVPRNADVPSHHHAKIDLSNDILTEVSQNFNAASSAAFTSLALLQRYTKSGEASLMASSNLISKLTELEKRGSSLLSLTESSEGRGPTCDAAFERAKFRESSSSSSSKSDELRNQGGRTEIKSEKRKPLTIEQQATQQRLKSAWKIAVERDDKLAIEKILSAMRDLERELEDDADENDSPEESSLERIKKAMQMSEDQVGLIADLEDAAMMDVDSDEI
ncbi:hypothetical protein THAOC_37802 [Thalassiosira oceanica]|uniref:Uncharacterized protein n=1 Tax=Thalassiosira oceanica TaxID=159749 RepID=K0QYF8_THAOC|nr:hypothetical protein THAOC_37802 [Thalassiosira oceanica]|eukprot:EJK43735.1 hypothetical protein THAOC_37802 [Thalassiosira oceanica]